MVENSDAVWLQIQENLEKNFKWINVYSVMDPVSGFLVFYQTDAQKALPHLLPLVAHTAYWDDPEFYNFVCSEFF